MPILLTQESPVMGIWEITEPWQDMLKSFQHNDDYYLDANRIQSDKRKQEWLAVRLLLKHLYETEAYIDYRDNGAPILQNSQYHISISHTMGYAAILLSENHNPGIDIEYRSERAWKLRKKYLGEKEFEMFALLHESEQKTGNNALSKHIDLSTLCWCAKETAFKALQQTEVDFIEHLHILPFTLSSRGVLLLKETKTSQQQTFNINYQIAENYIITWKE